MVGATRSCTKDLLKRVNYAELETCLVEVEAVINHGPLTFVTENQDDLIPLTPVMFVYDLPYGEVPETKLLTVTSLDKKRKNLKISLDELKHRFRTEYLGQLVQSGKERKTLEFKVGEIVLVEDLWANGKNSEADPGGRMESLVWLVSGPRMAT